MGVFRMKADYSAIRLQRYHLKEKSKIMTAVMSESAPKGVLEKGKRDSNNSVSDLLKTNYYVIEGVGTRINLLLEHP